MINEKEKESDGKIFTACRIKVREITRIQVFGTRSFIGRR